MHRRKDLREPSKLDTCQPGVAPMSTELASTEQPDAPTPDNSVASNHADSQLFLVRLWLDEDTQQAEGEPGSEAANRWRGRVQHLLHGETSLFIGWDMLVACLQAMLLSH